MGGEYIPVPVEAALAKVERRLQELGPTRPGVTNEAQ